MRVVRGNQRLELLPPIFTSIRKGTPSWKAPFLGSILVFGGVLDFSFGEGLSKYNFSKGVDLIFFIQDVRRIYGTARS